MIRVPASGPSNAKIMLVAEHVGTEEMRFGKPFAGSSGYTLDRLLGRAGLNRSQIYITNVIKFAPKDMDLTNLIATSQKDGKAKGFTYFQNKWVDPCIPECVQELRKEIEAVQPNVIIAMGNVAMWALFGQEGITKWAGYVEPATLVRRRDGGAFKVIPILHAAYVGRVPEVFEPTVIHLKRVREQSLTPAFNEISTVFHLRPAADHVIQFCEHLLHLPEREFVASDIETRSRHIACIGIGTNREAMCIPFMCAEDPSGYYTADQEYHVVRALKKLHTQRGLIGQNYAYDAQYEAKSWGLMPKIRHDCLVAQGIMYPGTTKSLEYLASLYLDCPRYWKDETKEWDPRKYNYDTLWSYNCKDIVNTAEVAIRQDQLIDVLNLREQFNFHMNRLWRSVFRMMLRGVRQNLELKPKLSRELAEAAEERQQWLTSIVGHPLNPRSPQQMVKFFYGDLRIKPVINPKTKGVTCDKEALQVIVKREPLLKQIVDVVEEIRSIGIFKSTFVDAEVDTDDRMRCSYNIVGAGTLRFSSSENAFGSGGNLQNVPLGTATMAQYVHDNGRRMQLLALCRALGYDKWGTFIEELEKEIALGALLVTGFKEDSEAIYKLAMPNVRKLFIPDPGYIIGDFDLMRADLYTVAWEANDTIYKQALNEKVDIHTMNAKDLSIPRKLAKSWCHGTNYKLTPRSAAGKFGITVHLAEKLQKKYFQIHSGILKWHERIEHDVKTKRKVTNAFGYHMFYFGELDDKAVREAIAWGPQSTTALVINKGLVNIDETLPDVHVLLQTHDSVTVQFPKEVREERIPQIKKALEVVVPYDDPMIIPCDEKLSELSWGHCK